MLLFKNVLLELLAITVAKNVGIVWETTNAIISMEAAHKGAHQDTKETDAKIVRVSSIIV